MAKLSLKDIKKENVRLVLEAIARKKRITKLEISEETGLSLMTVGKVVNLLGENGLIMHSKNMSQKVGRRAEMLRIRHDWLIPVFEIASRVFRFYITTLEGEVVDKIEYICTDDPKSVSSEFVNFLQNTLELLKKKYKNKKSLGVGVSVAGVYDEENDKILSSMIPELSSIKLMQNIGKIFKSKNIIVGNATRLYAEGIVSSTENSDSMTICCLSIGDTIECITSECKYYISGSKNLAGRIGDLPYASGHTYANFIRNAKNTTDIFDPILDMLKFVSIAYDPDKIFLCSSRFVFTPQLVSRLQSSLQSNMLWIDKAPEILPVYSSDLEGMSAIISRVVEKWLDNLVDA